GDHVLGADGELAAPRRAPGQAQAQAFPLIARLAVDLDHAADDVGAERAVAAAHAQRLAVPAMGQARRFGYRYQTRARISAGDGDVGLAADVLLAEHLQVVLLELAGTGQRGAGGF